MRLLSHWNLRDEIKADYADGQAGLAKQLMISKVMERIVDQSIPKVVINNPNYDWNPFSNVIKPAVEIDSQYPIPRPLDVQPEAEPNTRYEMWLKTFQAERLIDPYSPNTPTHIARSFNEDRELAEQRVKKMFEDVLTSLVAGRVAKAIEQRLGRKLEPFDIWYNGFREKSKYTEAQLDEIVKKKYPDQAAFKKDIPKFLVKLGFTKQRAQFIADHIEVDPARGSGHAMGSSMRGANAHLRTRIAKDGMNYKGFNIAVHELGHNVEQVLSLYAIDHTLLQGVPNTAFTEAMAFVFQAHDLQLLGLAEPDAKSEALRVLNDYWMTYEIAAVALVDIAVWHWMYDHPNATASEMKTAVLSIAKDTWNKYCAPLFGQKDVTLLAIYSHMVDSFMYLPDYPIGHMIAFQVNEKMKQAGAIGKEFERMVTQGRIAPDQWMRGAVGLPVGPEALITAAAQALEKL
jgi:hypothetical protein